MREKEPGGKRAHEGSGKGGNVEGNRQKIVCSGTKGLPLQGERERDRRGRPGRDAIGGEKRNKGETRDGTNAARRKRAERRNRVVAKTDNGEETRWTRLTEKGQQNWEKEDGREGSRSEAAVHRTASDSGFRAPRKDRNRSLAADISHSEHKAFI